MAEGEAANHQDFFEYACDLCGTGEVNAEATQYCYKCDIQLCNTCRELHDEDFRDTHRLLLKDKRDKWGKHPSIVKGHTEINVHTKDDDQHRCDIQGMCQLEDGRIVLSDTKNMKLKLLDNNYGVIRTLKMEGKPTRICCAREGEVAVALKGKNEAGKTGRFVQFVNVTNEGMNKTFSINVGLTCKGLAYYKQQLYVAPGRFGNQIFIYDINDIENGPLVERVPINSPTSVTVSSTGDRILIVGIDNNIVITDKKGKLQDELYHTMLKNTGVKDICMDGRGNVFLSTKVGTVLYFNETNQNIQEFSAGVHMPETLLVDTHKWKLLLQKNNLFGGSDVIHIYDIKYKSREQQQYRN